MVCLGGTGWGGRVQAPSSLGGLSVLAASQWPVVGNRPETRVQPPLHHRALRGREAISHPACRRFSPPPDIDPRCRSWHLDGGLTASCPQSGFGAVCRRAFWLSSEGGPVGT